MFPGTWSVGQVERNLPAEAFWRTIISDYTGGRFEETTDPEWGKGPVRVFESRVMLNSVQHPLVGPESSSG